MKRVLLVVGVALSVILPIKTWAQWETQVVDTTGNVGTKCAIAVDANGYSHISYRDGTIGWRLKYANWDGSVWQIAFVETTESVYGVTSIALDGDGNPHIAFDKGYGVGAQLWHAWSDGSNWQQEGVDSLPYNGDVGEWNSIAFDTDGYPHIAYTYSTGDYDCYLRYAYKDASGWHIQVADSLLGDEFQYVSMVLDDRDNPHISYYDYSAYDLKYAYFDGTTWQIDTVDATGHVGTHSSIALDSLEYPHIAYSDGSNYGVKYVRWNGSAWHIETVESDIGYGFYTSLALDANDRPHISSAEYMGNLRFAYWDGSDWQIEVVDNTVCCGWTSLAIDDSGYCHIAYYDGGDSTNLKYAKRPTTGIEETAKIKVQNAKLEVYPNPFSTKTSIQYAVGSKQEQLLTPYSLLPTICIYDLSGRLIRSFSNSQLSVSWDGRDEQGESVRSGIYFCYLEAGKHTLTTKLVIVR